MTTENNATGQKREWNYHPALPLQNPSIFRWPMSPVLLLQWFFKNWLTLSERVLLVLLAVVMWYFFYPTLASAVDFSASWMLQVYAINFVLMVAIAGSLHGYFYIYRGQEDHLKFDHRGMGKSKLWNFESQVKDNMFWSLGSGVLQLSVYQIVSMWLMANGYVPVLSFADNPIWFLLLFVLVPVWSAFHFYWVHRLLHYPWLYKRVHSLHHRNISIGPWSGFSMHPVEHLLYLSSLCIHWVLASHPIHLYYHVIFVGPGAAMTHTGYEDLLIRDKRKLALGTFYHQLHHRFFNCNYGNQELPMDRWFGTFHDGTTDATAAMRQRSLRR